MLALYGVLIGGIALTASICDGWHYVLDFGIVKLGLGKIGLREIARLW
jgi:hypothetical protein